MAFKGWIEPKQGDVISGWAIDGNGNPCRVTARLNGEAVSAASDLPRPDLAARGLSKGAGGFHLSIGHLLQPGENAIDVVFDDDTPVPGGPVLRTVAPPVEASLTESLPTPASEAPVSLDPPRVEAAAEPARPAAPMTIAELDDLSLNDISDAVASGRISVEAPRVPPMPEPAAPPLPPQAEPERRGWLARLFGR